jgi:hypothetical protein
MAKILLIVALLVIPAAIGLSFLAATAAITPMVWTLTVLPLIVALLGFIVAFILSITGQVNEENVKTAYKYLAGVVSGVTVAKASDYWKAFTSLVNAPTLDASVFVVGTNILLLFGGIAAGLYVGLVAKPHLAAAKQAAGTAETNFTTLLSSIQRLVVA